MRNTKPQAVAAGVAVLALVACGGGSGEESTSPDARLSGSAAGQAFDPDREAPAAPIDGAVEGGTVTALSYFDAGSMDPTEAFRTETVSILSGLVTRSLTQYVYDPTSGSMVLVPDLATDIGTPNTDFTEWSFTIRNGVRFEDGTEVTADDVAYGIKRSFDRAAFPDGSTISNDYFLDGDTYKGPYRSGTSYPGIVVDGNTLTIKMERPFPEMPYWGSWPAIGPIPERGSDPATYGRHPLATGPYKFADYSPGKSLSLVRNDQWDPDTDPGRHQYPDEYEFSFGIPAKQINATILGDSEAAQTTLSINAVAGDQRRARALDRLTLGSAPCTYMVFPDYRKITDIRVRRAIGYAYPYREDASALGDVLGVTVLPGSSILPPDFPGRQDYDVLETEPGRTDADKAKALLQEAGYVPGEYELKFPYVTSDSTWVERKDRLVKALEAAGFKVTPFPTSSHEANSEVSSDPDAPINLRLNGWCSEWPTGGAWFPQLFHSDGAANQAYFEPAVDAEIERISRLPIQEQPAAWGALDKSLMTDYYPAIITSYSGAAMLHGSRIGGMNADSVYTMPTWKDIYVSR